MALIREIAADEGLTVVCSLHQVDLAISWAERIVGLRHGEVVLDTPTGDLTKAEVMEIYGRVATTTAEIRAVQEELVEAAAQVARIMTALDASTDSAATRSGGSSHQGSGPTVRRTRPPAPRSRPSGSPPPSRS